MAPAHRALGTTLRTRPTLLLRVRNPLDAVSWQEFHELYRRLVYGRARRAGLAHEDAEDVVQEVFARVAASIARFDPDPQRGSFRGWLMHLTDWRIADHFARRRGMAGVLSAHRGTASSRTSTTDRVPSPPPASERWEAEWREQVLAVATRRLARHLKPQHFQVFDCYMRQHGSALSLAAKLHLNPASVYVIAHRVLKQLQAEVARVQRQFG